MGYRPDEIDKQIIYRLMADARNTSASAIAENVSVSGATVRNRIKRLEERGILTGYTAHVDFERLEGRLTNLFVCTTDVADREQVAGKVQEIPGVVDVRVYMAGQRNLHVTAVGADMDDLSRIARALSKFDLDIEEERFQQHHFSRPYEPYGPSDTRRPQTLTDFMSLAGGSELVEFTVPEGAAISGTTLEQAAEADLIDENVLVVAIERDDEIVTPKGGTRVRPDDVLTVFVIDRDPENVLADLVGEAAST
ncbi:MAG: winged helix-turn-helix transcriptional regulator [Halobacterium sp.]